MRRERRKYGKDRTKNSTGFHGTFAKWADFIWWYEAEDWSCLPDGGISPWQTDFKSAGGKYAEIKKEAKELLLQNNIVNVDWNALTGDAETNNLSVEFEMTRLTETMGSKNSLVILMHDAAAKSVTADALPQIIAKLKEEGYEFKNFYDIIK